MTGTAKRFFHFLTDRAMYNTREQDFENELEFENEFEFEYDQESGGGFDQEFSDEFDMEFLTDQEGEMGDSMEMEIAGELLTVTSDQELDQFLGKLARRAGRAVVSFAKSPAGNMIKGALKNVAKKALPIAGKAIGTYFGGSAGGAIGGKLGTMATRLFELELEGLSPEDQEFEVSKAYVRFANDALRKGATAAKRNPNANPQQIVRTALRQSASQHAPGLLNNSAGRRGRQNGSLGRARKGTWVRKGRAVILYEM